MTDLIIFVLSSYAGWYVFSTAELPYWNELREKLMEKSPDFAKFVYCPMCSGFWVAVAVSYYIPILGKLSLVQGLAGAATTYLIERHMARLEER